MTLHPYEHGIRPGSLGHGDPAQYDYLTIKSFFANAKPSDLEGLQQAYTNLQSALQDLEQRLGQHTKRLDQIWDGDAQQAGTSEIKQLTENAATLAKASAQFGTAMSSGAAALRNPPQIPPPSGPAGALPGLIGEAAASPADTKAAQEALAKTNTSLASAFNQIPSTLAIGRNPDFGDTPYIGAPGRRGSGGGSGLGGQGAGTGLPSTGARTGGHGGSAAAPSPRLSTAHPSGPTSVGGPPVQSPGTSGHTPGSAPSDLAGSPPGVQQHPGNAPLLPGTTGPGTDGRVPSAPGPLVPGPGGGTAHPPIGDGDRPLRPGRGSPRLPKVGESPNPLGTRPLPGGTSGIISSRGVIGGNNLKGLGAFDPEPPLPSGSAAGPRQVAPDGVLRNSTLRAGAEASASAAEARQANAASGFPMTGGVGGGRSGERTRDVALIEDGDLWKDETQVSPRVLGKPDREDEDRRT